MYLSRHVPLGNGPPLGEYPDFVAASVVIVLCLLVATGAESSTRFNIFLAIINICVVVFIIVSGEIYSCGKLFDIARLRAQNVLAGAWIWSWCFCHCRSGNMVDWFWSLQMINCGFVSSTASTSTDLENMFSYSLESAKTCTKTNNSDEKVTCKS